MKSFRLSAFLPVALSFLLTNCTLKTNIEDLAEPLTAPYLTISDVSLNEGDTGAFVVSLSKSSALEVVFQYSSSGGSATSGIDFTALSGTMTIPALSSSVLLPVVTADDLLSEGDEVFTVALTNPINAILQDGLAVGTIVDNEGLPSLFIADGAAVTEGQSSDFTVSLSATSGLDVSFSFRTWDGTAVLTQDYVARPLTVATIPAGSLSYTLRVATIDDLRDEVNTEYFDVSLSSSVNALISRGVGQGAIDDNDSPPTIFIADGSALEGGTAQFLVTISALSDLNVEFLANTEDGLGPAVAQASADYTALNAWPGQIPAGSLSVLVGVTTLQEVLYEADENFTVTLSGLVNTSLGGDGVATGTILNDDVMPDIFIGDAGVTEGQTAWFAVTISAVSGLDSIFTWQTTAGTAVAGSDYTTVPATVATIPAGSLTTALSVVTIDDVVSVEPDEAFNVTLTTLSNVSSGRTNGVGTISDNDLIFAYVSDVSVSEGETLEFWVTISALSSSDVSFNYRTFDGAATTADNDYAAVNSSGVITAGLYGVTIPVVTIQDTKYEGNETLTFSLSALSGAYVGDGLAIGTINNDEAIPTLAILDSEVVEGVPLVFTVTQSALSAFATTFSFEAFDGNSNLLGGQAATAGLDYTATSGVGSIAAGQLSFTVPVMTLQDSTYEGAENFVLSISSVVNAAVVDPVGLGNILNDDCPAIGWCQQAYIKATNADVKDFFGWSTDISLDTMITGAVGDDSSATSLVNGSSPPFDNMSDDTDIGAVHVYKRTGNTWAQQAWLRPGVTPIGGYWLFGLAAGISGDTIVVGTTGEFSGRSGVINGPTYPDEGAFASGAAWVFHRTGNTWVHQAYLKSSNPGEGDQFGLTVAIDGDTIVVGAPNEDSNVTGVINGTGGSGDNSFLGAGAAYVFKRTGNTWVQQAMLKPSNPGASDSFAFGRIGLSEDTIVIGAPYESGSQTGVTNGATFTANDSTISAGGAYVFHRTGNTWVQQAYLKQLTTADLYAYHGYATDISGDTIIVGAPGDGNYVTGVTNGVNRAYTWTHIQVGSATIYQRTGNTWVAQAYLKPTNIDVNDHFGYEVRVAGNLAMVHSPYEDSAVSSITNGVTASADNSQLNSGAIYLFRRTGNTWAQEAFVKLPNNMVRDDEIALAGGHFHQTLFGLTEDTLTWGSPCDSSDGIGAHHVPYASFNKDRPCSGAVHIFKYSGAPKPMIVQAAGQSDPAATFPLEFTVNFTVPIKLSSFTPEDIVNAGTANGITWTITDTGDNQTFNLTAMGGSPGTYIPTIRAETVAAASAGSIGSSRTEFDNSVTFTPVNSGLFIFDAAAAEGNNLIFVASLSSASVTDVVFEWRTFDLSAESGSDYTGAGQSTRTIVAGQVTATLTVASIPDTTAEGDETFQVALSNISNGDFVDNVAIGTIIDDDVPPTVVISDANVAEGQPAVFWVSLDRAFRTAVTMNYASVPGSAEQSGGAGVPDYDPSSGTLNIPIGSTSGAITVTTVVNSGGTESELENFTISLSSLSAGAFLDNIGVGSILDSSATPGVYISDTSVIEGGTAFFTISLSGKSVSQSTFSWNTMNGSAVANLDYLPVKSTTTTIPADVLSVTIPVVTLKDEYPEGVETFRVTITAATAANVSIASGTGSIADAVMSLTVDKVYPNNGNWMDYVRNNNGGTNEIDQPDIACTGSETGLIEACIHGGEKRKMALPGFTRCEQIRATDSANALNWDCLVVKGTATVFSHGLKPGARLADLVGTNSFNNMSLNVYFDGIQIATSAPTIWWGNSVSAPDANTGAGNPAVTLGVPGRVYVVASNTATSGYNLNADKVSFVVKPGATLSYSGRTSPNTNIWGAPFGELTTTPDHTIISAGSNSFLWVEGRFDTSAYDASWTGIFMGFYNVKFSTFRHINMYGGATTKGGIGLSGSVSNKFSNLTFEQTRGDSESAFYSYNSSYTRFHNIIVNARGSAGAPHSAISGGCSNCLYYNLRVLNNNGTTASYRGYAVDLQDSSNSTMVNVLAVGSDAAGFHAYNSDRITYHHIHSANSGTDGFALQATPYATINQAVFANNGTSGSSNSGLTLQDGSNSLRASQAAIAHHSLASETGIFLSSDSGAHTFLHNMLLGNNATNCHSDGATNPGFVSGPCANAGSSAATWRTTLSLASAFVGKVTINDGANASDTNGLRAIGSIADWVNFDNGLRGWGRDGSAFPAADHRGSCDAGNCRVWDWSLRASDTSLRNISGSGSITLPNAAFVASQPCPAAVSGNVVVTDQHVVPRTFLANAVEIIGDFENGKMLGNDNGLCESFEACVYSPNIGLYQGHGDYLSGGTCAFQSGAVIGVKIYSYPMNGY